MATRTVPASSGGDDQTILQNTFSSAVAGDTIAYTSATYRHSAALAWPSATGVIMQGTGVTLLATNPAAAALRITGTAANDGEIIGLTHRVLGASTRIDRGEDVAPFVLRQGVRRFKLTRTVSDGSAGLGYFLYGCHDGVSTSIQSLNSLADGIHSTAGTSGWVHNDPVVTNSGDDGIPFIGYLQDGEAGRPNNNTVNNPVLTDCRARGVAFSGAYNITVNNLDSDGTLAAAVMFAVERGDFNTSPTTNCHVYGGRVARAGTSYAAIPGGTDGQGKDQGGVLWLASGDGSAVTNCTVNDLSTGNFASVNYDTMRAIIYGAGSITQSSANRTLLFAGSPSTYVGGNQPSVISPQTSTNRRSESLPARGSGGGVTPTPSTGLRTLFDGPQRTNSTGPGTADTGQTVTAQRGTWVTGNGRLYSSTQADDDQVTYPLGAVDHLFGAEVYGAGAANAFPEVMVRWTSATDHYWAEANPSGQVVLLRRTSNAFNTLAQTASGVFASGARLDVGAQEINSGAATRLTAYVNGVAVLTFDDTATNRPMGTSAGFRHGAGAGGISLQFAQVRGCALGDAVAPRSSASWLLTGTSLAVQMPVVPPVGSKVLAFVSIDKDPGTLTIPAGWTQFLPSGAPSIALVCLFRTAQGNATDRGFTLGWTNAQGAQAIALEIAPQWSGSIRPTDTGSGSSDGSVTTLTTAGAAAAAGPVLHVLAVDTGVTAFTGSGDPQWSKTVTRLHSNPGSTSGTNINGGPSLDVVRTAVAAANDDVGITSSWATADQAHMRSVLLSSPSGTGGSATSSATGTSTASGTVSSGGGGAGGNRVLPTALRKYRASSITGLANGASVASWPEASGGVALTQGTAASQPTFTTSALNGKPGVNFQNSAKFLQATTATQAQPTTLTVVVDGLPGGEAQAVHHGAELLKVTSNGWVGYAGNGGETTPTLTGPQVVTFVANGSSSATYVNGSLRWSGDAGTIGMSATLRVGLHTDGGRRWIGNILEVHEYAKVLTAAERQAVHSQVQDDYAITVADYAPAQTAGAATSTATGNDTAAATRVTQSGGAQSTAVGTSTATGTATLSPRAPVTDPWDSVAGKPAEWSTQDRLGGAVFDYDRADGEARITLAASPVKDQNATARNAASVAQPSVGDFDVSFPILSEMLTGSAFSGIGVAAYDAARDRFVTLYYYNPPGGMPYTQWAYANSASTWTSYTNMMNLVNMVPVHFRLRRVGNVWSAFTSENGTSWLQFGASQTITDFNQTQVGWFAIGGSGGAFTSRIGTFRNLNAPAATGTATSTATGTSTTAATPRPAVTAGSVATGTTGAVASAPKFTQSASTLGVGADTATGTPAHRGAAAASGTGTSTAVAIGPGAATSSAVGTSTASGTPAFPGASVQPWVTLFTDTFSRTESAGTITGYSQGAAGWSTTGDRLRLTDTTSAVFLLATATDGNLDQRISTMQYGGANNGVMVRYVNSQNYYGFRRAGAVAQIFTVLNNTTTLVGSAISCVGGQPIALQVIESADGQATILTPFVDGVEGPSVILTSAAQRLTGTRYGYRAITASGGAAEFDDLRIESRAPATAATGVPATSSGTGTGATVAAPQQAATALSAAAGTSVASGVAQAAGVASSTGVGTSNAYGSNAGQATSIASGQSTASATVAIPGPGAAPQFNPVYANDFSATGLGSAWTNTGVAFVISGGRLQSSTATGVTSNAAYNTPSSTPDLGISYRLWRSTQRGLGIVRLGQTPDNADSISISASFDNATGIDVIQRVASTPTTLGTLPYANGALLLAYTQGDVLWVAIEGASPVAFPLAPRPANARGWEIASNTASPRWQFDDLTLYEVTNAPAAGVPASSTGPSASSATGSLAATSSAPSTADGTSSATGRVLASSTANTGADGLDTAAATQVTASATAASSATGSSAATGYNAGEGVAPSTATGSSAASGRATASGTAPSAAVGASTASGVTGGTVAATSSAVGTTTAQASAPTATGGAPSTAAGTSSASGRVALTATAASTSAGASMAAGATVGESAALSIATGSSAATGVARFTATATSTASGDDTATGRAALASAATSSAASSSTAVVAVSIAVAATSSATGTDVATAVVAVTTTTTSTGGSTSVAQAAVIGVSVATSTASGTSAAAPTAARTVGAATTLALAATVATAVGVRLTGVAAHAASSGSMAQGLGSRNLAPVALVDGQWVQIRVLLDGQWSAAPLRTLQ